MDGMRKSIQTISLTKTGYWFEDKQNRLVLKNIMDFLSSFPQQGQCSIQMDSQNHVQLLVKRDSREELFYFPKKFPIAAPDVRFRAPDGTFIPMNNKWIFEGNILESFVKYYKSLNNYDGR